MIEKDYKNNSDQEGYDTLATISKATNFNRWMYSAIASSCRGKILEIGSGIGNISQFFVTDEADIYLSEINLEHVAYLKKHYAGIITEDKIFELNLVDPDFDNKYASLFNTFDSIFALNVIEHIEEADVAMLNMKKLLKENGNSIILVPAFQTLYNTFDTNLGHFKRYTKKTLSELISGTGYKIEKTFYFNFFGMFGWFVVGSVLRKKVIPENSMGLFDKLVFLTKNLDKVFSGVMGLSVVCVAKK